MYEMNNGAKSRQIHGLLAGGIAATDDHKRFVPEGW